MGEGDGEGEEGKDEVCGSDFGVSDVVSALVRHRLPGRVSCNQLWVRQQVREPASSQTFGNINYLKARPGGRPAGK